MGDLQYKRGQALAVPIGSPAQVQLPPDAADGGDRRFLVHDATFTPLAATKCTVQVPSGKSIPATSDAQGWIKVALPQGTQKVTIVASLEKGKSISYDVAIPPDDATSDAFFEAHLKNFGFDRPGETDQQMLIRFQIAKGLPVTGQLDDATKSAVRKLAGGDGSLAQGFSSGGDS